MSALLNPIRPSRVRSLPKSYSWLDHRLVHEGYLKKLSCEAATLYLFLLTVGDRFGMSYYSERAICKRLNVGKVYAARDELIAADLLAYAKPIYQVLSLPEKVSSYRSKTEVCENEVPATGEEISELFKKFHGGRR